MKTDQTPMPRAFYLVLILEYLYLEFVSDLVLRISNFIVSPPEEIHNYELRTKNSKLTKSVSICDNQWLKKEIPLILSKTLSPLCTLWPKWKTMAPQWIRLASFWTKMATKWTTLAPLWTRLASGILPKNTKNVRF